MLQCLKINNRPEKMPIEYILKERENAGLSFGKNWDAKHSGIKIDYNELQL